MEADRCEIYSDVDGIYTADPRTIKSASKLNYISYEEMLELANLGANVLHPRAVELAKIYDVELYIASSFNKKRGTIVRGVEDMEGKKNIVGVTCDLEDIKITVEKVPDKPGIAGFLFSSLADKGVNVDMIIQNLQRDNLNDITFTIKKNNVNKAEKVLDNIKDELNFENLEIDTEVAKISIVGAGMKSTPGIAAQMFKILGENNINIEMITTSEIKISCLIERNMVDRALNILHKEFELDKIND